MPDSQQVSGWLPDVLKFAAGFITAVLIVPLRVVIEQFLYQHYSTSERAAYLSLDEAPTFTNLYGEISNLKGSEAADVPSALTMVENVFAIFERYLREHTLDENILLKYRAKHREKTLERLASYYRAGGNGIIRDNQACVPSPARPPANPEQ